MPRTTSTVDRLKQTKATAASKRARIEEAGMGGRRTGKASARTRAAQARRDRKTNPDLAPAATAVAAPGTTPKATGPKGAPAAATKRASSPAKRRKSRATPMVEVRTSSSVAGGATLDARVERVVSTGLSLFAGQLTRVDVYLSDENAARKGPDDKRCQIEARPTWTRAVSVAATSDTVGKALASAVGKMKRLLATRLAKPAAAKPGRARPTRAGSKTPARASRLTR